MKLKSTKKHLYGRTNSVPYAGTLEISAEGFVEIEDEEIANKVVALDCGYVHVDAKGEPVVEETEEEDESEKIEKVETDEIGKADKKEDENEIGTAEDKKEDVISGVVKTAEGTETPPATEETKTEEPAAEATSESTEGTEDKKEEAPAAEEKKEEAPEDKKEESTEDQTPEQIEEMKKELGKMKVADLQELAKPFPKKDWKDLKKDDLVSYLADKI